MGPRRRACLRNEQETSRLAEAAQVFWDQRVSALALLHLSVLTKRGNLYGGLARQEPYDPKGIMSRLRRLAEKEPSVCYPGQYHNDHVGETSWLCVRIY